ncbi:TonB-dependent receptor [Flavobacterium hercynium]|uniref:Energy transducer TonB n=1 Tax=Flavobacterium hercynium TaxID=387094 RepID=A0A226H8B9_9FLAO|nr:TonB-dependent receptor [Flavobacterium hercynium]OXA90493.1 energy transducer TonB [Flavobacterium hercynium]SMP28740.1 Outer membrane receptor proteins, mostly Fe transport [Flavobacterium hercynium]
MTTHKFLFSSIFFLFTFLSFSQQNQGLTVSGQVVENSGQSIPFATLIIEKTDFSLISDENGNFTFKNIPAGKYNIVITAVGFSTQKKQVVVAEKDVTVSVKLSNELNELESVTVLGRSQVEKVNKQAYNVTAIDAKKLHNSTLDLAHALDRVSGVRVRESGGVGSRSELSINGFTGNQVKIFIDGVPMENFGSSFQMNNIPINLAERVEVYKGVVPIWLGGDALGGAVNIVTSSKPRTYLDASYSFGSFNTHRSTLNAGYTAKSGFTTEINAFQNYSDNNYWVNVDIADLNTGAYFPNQRVRKFHDQYKNETVIFNIGVTGKKYADKLLFGVTVGENKADIQTGARMKSVFGKMQQRGNTLMPTVKYQVRDLFTKGLNVNLTANYNFGQEQNIDTVFRRYNWFGDYKEYPGDGSERSRTLRKFKNNNGISTTNIMYTLNDRHSFTVNNTFSSSDRKESDELVPESLVYQQPKKIQKNILGVGYKFDYNEKWSTSVFGKSYFLKNIYSRSYNPSGNVGDVAYQQYEDKTSSYGFGGGSSYYLRPNLQLKGTFEKSYRLPSINEVFGNVNENLEGNLDLRPETSNNFNLGFSYQTSFNKVNALTFDMNVLYRDATDFIRPTLNNNQTMTTNVNQGRVTNHGIDGEIRYSYRNKFTAGINATYQNIRNMTEYEPNQDYVSPVYKDRIPNMPYMFGNADASYIFNDFGRKGNNLALGYNLLYVHAYYLYWPSMGGSDKLDIPEQFNHDLNAVYTFANGKYNIALECKNVLDNKLYDNFSLQKPSRAFNIKFRYFFSKSTK